MGYPGMKVTITCVSCYLEFEGETEYGDHIDDPLAYVGTCPHCGEWNRQTNE